MKGYSDLADLPEDDRIAAIGRCVTTQKLTVAVAVDDKRKKIDRYRRKLETRFPGLLDIEEVGALTPGVMILKVKPKLQNVANN